MLSLDSEHVKKVMVADKDLHMCCQISVSPTFCGLCIWFNVQSTCVFCRRTGVNIYLKSHTRPLQNNCDRFCVSPWTLRVPDMSVMSLIGRWRQVWLTWMVCVRVTSPSSHQRDDVKREERSEKRELVIVSTNGISVKLNCLLLKPNFFLIKCNFTLQMLHVCLNWPWHTRRLAHKMTLKMSCFETGKMLLQMQRIYVAAS